MSGLAARRISPAHPLPPPAINGILANLRWVRRASAGHDAKQWEEIRLLAEARGVEAKDILFRCIRFGINQLRDDGKGAEAARKAAVEKRRSKKSA